MSRNPVVSLNFEQCVIVTSVIAHDDDYSITNLMTDDLVVLKAAKFNK